MKERRQGGGCWDCSVFVVRTETRPMCASFRAVFTLHTAKGFVALISFYEFRTSRITTLNTMGAAR